MEDLFCGSADNYPISHFTPKSLPWDSNELIGHIDRHSILLPEKEIETAKSTFWDNLCSEYDAENFCEFLHHSGVSLTPEFKSFEFVWRRDEYNHYIGFKHIYSLLYNSQKDVIETDLISRPVNFDPIKPMLEDEFKICLLLAYDEIATTKSYAADYEYYSLLGPAELLKWIKLVTRDEAYHFNNCMELIGKNFYNRVHEIPDLVDQFIHWDLERKAYVGTFVLDHENYTPEFLYSCADIMKSYFNRHLR